MPSPAKLPSAVTSRTISISQGGPAGPPLPRKEGEDRVVDALRAALDDLFRQEREAEQQRAGREEACDDACLVPPPFDQPSPPASVSHEPMVVPPQPKSTARQAPVRPNCRFPCVGTWSRGEISPRTPAHDHTRASRRSAGRLSFGDSVAIDTETMGLNPHRDRLCAVQLSAGDGDAHVVQILPGQREAPNLVRLLADPKVVKIFHFARFDVAVLRHAFGVETHPLYCTKIASRLTRTFTDRHGLKDLVRELTGVELCRTAAAAILGLGRGTASAEAQARLCRLRRAASPRSARKTGRDAGA